MKVGDLPVGAHILLGAADDRDLEWVKVTTDSRFFLISCIAKKMFDAREHNSQSAIRRSCGNNFYPHSNIHQWLNGRGSEWFTETHPEDERTFGYFSAGFLTEFMPDELDAMADQEIVVAVPVGSRKQFGRKYTITAKVWLPSASEFGYEDPDVSCEGEPIEALIDLAGAYPGIGIMTRTGVRDGGHVIHYSGLSPLTAMARIRSNIRPMICLKQNTEVSDPDSN